MKHKAPMSDSEWLQNTKSGQRPAPDPPPTSPPPPATSTPDIDVPTPTTGSSRWMQGFIVVTILVGLYFYHDTQTRTADRIAAQKAAKRADAAPRVMTAAEIQANDAKNRAYAKKLEDDYYRQQISAGVLQLNDLANRFNDLNQVASATARIALPQLVQQMQALRREAAAITTHQCLRPAATSLTDAIGGVIKGYLSFMQSGNDADNSQTKQHLDSARATLNLYIKQRDACVTW